MDEGLERRLANDRFRFEAEEYLYSDNLRKVGVVDDLFEDTIRHFDRFAGQDDWFADHAGATLGHNGILIEFEICVLDPVTSVLEDADADAAGCTSASSRGPGPRSSLLPRMDPPNA